MKSVVPLSGVMSTTARIAVSSCLLGQRVRYDGKQKRISWIAQVLPSLFEVLPICPEVGAGLSVPRPPIQVVDASDGLLRLKVVGEGTDVSDGIARFMEEQIRALKEKSVDGYLLKARSPSCGIRDTPHFSSAAKEAQRVRIASGVWAQRISEEFADLPMFDESDVADKVGQERFLEQVRAHHLRRSQR